MAFAPTRRQLLTGALGMVAAGLPGRARAEGRGNGHEHFEVTETELLVPGLDPAHDGLRVVQLSDLHILDHTPDGRVIAAVRAANAARPDLVLLTGDYVTWSKKPIAHLPLVLGGLQAPTVAVLGNHDHYVDAPAVRQALEGMGYAVLQNENTRLRLRGVELALIGIDDGRTRHDDVGKAFAGVAARGSRLVLAHNPPTADKLPQSSGLACFSGHTHGGQVHLPGFTNLIMRVAGQPYVRGLYRVNGNLLYVNRGLGFGAGSITPRVGSDPELSIFTLRVA